MIGKIVFVGISANLLVGSVVHSIDCFFPKIDPPNFSRERFERPKPVLIKVKAPVLSTSSRTVDHKKVAFEKLVETVKSYESFRARPYYCPANVKTIGYGHTGKLTRLKEISRSHAETALRAELQEYWKVVKKNVSVDLSPYQIAALTSFTYNVGEGNLRRLVNGSNRLNSGNLKSVTTVLPAYNKARVGNKVKTLRGLTKRRSTEIDLWNTTI